MWKGPKEFFNYSRKERNGSIALFSLAFGLWGLYWAYDFYKPETYYDYSRFDAIISEWESSNHGDLGEIDSFHFDPNTVEAQELRKLGFEDYQVQVFLNYRKTGVQFKLAEDLYSVYSLDSNLLSHIVPLVRIEKNKSEHTQKRPLDLDYFDPNTVEKDELIRMGWKPWQAQGIITYRERVKTFESTDELYRVYVLDSGFVSKIIPYVQIDTPSQMVKSKSKAHIMELNSADSLSLIGIKGIGPTFAKRILKYRDVLGGYYKKEQLMEVYGMDSLRFISIKDQFSIDDRSLRKININKAEFRALLKHPYLNYDQVKALINFREHIREFNSVDELKNIDGISEEHFQKVSPYLRIDD